MITSTLAKLRNPCLTSALPQNPPAPKVRRRDSVGVEATGQICQTGAASAGGGHFRQSRPPKSAFCRSAQNRPTGPFRSNMAATLELRPTRQIGSNFGPAWLHDGAVWGHLGATSAQVEVHMASKWGHSRPNPKSAKHQFSIVVFTTFFAIDDASYESMFPMLCFRWAQLGAKLSPKGAKLRQVRTDLDKLGTVAPFTALTAFYRFFQRFLALMGGYGGARARPCCPHWACLGPNFGARSHKGPSCAC